MIATVLGTMVWLLIWSLKRSEDPAKLLFKWVLTFVFIGGLLAIVMKIGFEDNSAMLIPGVCAIFGVALGITWAPHWGAIMARPFTAMFDGGSTPPDPKPFYSVAFARRKQGRYEEAEKACQEAMTIFRQEGGRRGQGCKASQQNQGRGRFSHPFHAKSPRYFPRE